MYIRWGCNNEGCVCCWITGWRVGGLPNQLGSCRKQFRRTHCSHHRDYRGRTNNLQTKKIGFWIWEFSCFNLNIKKKELFRSKSLFIFDSIRKIRKIGLATVISILFWRWYWDPTLHWPHPCRLIHSSLLYHLQHQRFR